MRPAATAVRAKCGGNPAGRSVTPFRPRLAIRPVATVARCRPVMMNPPAAVTLRRRTDCLDHERLSKNMRRNFNFPLPRWLAIAVLALVALAQVWRHYEAPSIPGPTVPREAPPPSTRAPSIPAPSTPSTPARPYPSFLPAEAPVVIERILRGGPHPHRQDGGVFQNREGRLPSQPRG